MQINALPENRRVLAVDDQTEILDLIRRHLGTDYEVVTSNTPADALERVANDGPFAAVIADYAMPGIDGVSLLARVRELSPDTARVMLTAYDDLEVAVAALHRGSIFRFLSKPWQREDLRTAVADAVGHFELVHANRLLTARLTAINAELDAKVRELDELNRLLEYWVEFSPVVLYSAECDSSPPRLTYVSKNFAELTGHERTEMIVDPGFWRANIHPDDLAVVTDGVEAALAREEIRQSQLEYRVRRQDGSYLKVTDAFRVIRGQAGDPLEVVGAWLAAEHA